MGSDSNPSPGYGPATVVGVGIAGACVGIGLGFLLQKRLNVTAASSLKLLSQKGAERKFRLHVYDHCPFCIRVELVLGLREIPYERVVYGYGDVDGPTEKFGKKMLPVLEYENDVGVRTHLKESLDIIDYVETLEGDLGRLLPPSTGRFSKWTKQEYKPPLRMLARPRIINVPIGDWANPEDVEYAKQKYTKQGFDYEKAMSSTEENITKINGALKQLEKMIYCKDYLNPWGVSMDDILLVPELRTLTCVKGVDWPPLVLAYLTCICDRAHVQLYFDYAQE
uniref:GST N-terminal domain-containing protein n=1 Tax=Aplanochytrium stocchinoi TaxID=215587 RepID=A0A7S3PPM6_9STRA|mmetsp:Transcript_21131/g.25715  ORF Transcript_21131/g.25715 Transcript_21131/m.25715 type:complete len:281 (+) Transcript_21131:229-1071(+)